MLAYIKVFWTTKKKKKEYDSTNQDSTLECKKEFKIQIPTNVIHHIIMSKN